MMGPACVDSRAHAGSYRGRRARYSHEFSQCASRCSLHSGKSGCFLTSRAIDARSVPDVTQNTEMIIMGGDRYLRSDAISSPRSNHHSVTLLWLCWLVGNVWEQIEGFIADSQLRSCDVLGLLIAHHAAIPQAPVMLASGVILGEAIRDMPRCEAIPSPREASDSRCPIGGNFAGACPS